MSARLRASAAAAADRPKDIAYVVRHPNISDRAAHMLFPLPRLWDKAPLAATDSRPQAGGSLRGGAGDDAFFCA